MQYLVTKICFITIYSGNFIQVSTNMSRRARIVTLPFILFELFPLELCASQRQLSMTILYQVKIVQSLIYLTDIFTRYELIVCMIKLEFQLEIVFNVSV